MKYKVEITEIVRKYVDIEADSIGQAIDIAQDEYTAIDMDKDVIIEMEYKTVSGY